MLLVNRYALVKQFYMEVFFVGGRMSLSVDWITLFLMGTDLFVISSLLLFISEAFKVNPTKTGW